MSGVVEISAMRGTPADESNIGLKPWFSLLMICIIAALGFAHRYMLSIFVDPISTELHLTDVQFGVLQGASYALAYAGVSLIVGHWVDVASRILLLATGAVVWTAGSLLFALSYSYWMLIVARLLLGVGESVLLPAGISLIWDLFGPRRRGFAIGCFSVATALGVSLSSMIPGPLFDVITRSGMEPFGLQPWRSTYVIVSAVSLLLILPLLALREPPRLGLAKKNGGSTDAGGTSLWQKRAVLVPLYVGGMVVTSAEATLLAWTPTVLIRDFMLTRSEFAGWYGIVIFGSSVTGALSGGWLADRCARHGAAHRRMLPALAVAFVTCPLVWVLSTKSITLFGVMLAVMSTLFVAGSVSIMTALAASLPNELRGKATGVYAFLNTAVGLGVGQTLIPAIAAAMGTGRSLLPAILAVMSTSLFVGIIALAFGYWHSASTVKDVSHAA